MESAYAYVSLVVGVASILLGLLVIIGNPSNPINRAWLPISISIGVWSGGLSQEILSLERSTAYLWNQVFYTGGVWIPSTFLYFVLVFTGGNTKGRVLKAGFLLSAILNSILFIHPSWFIEDLTKMGPFRNWDVPGFAYHIFAIFFFVYIVYANLVLWKYYRHAEGYKRKQARMVFLASLVGFTGGGTNFPLVYKIPLLPIGHFLVFFYSVIISWAIIRYRIMDYFILLRETSVHVISSLAVSVVFIAVISRTNNRALIFSSMVMMAVSLPILYPALNRWIRKNLNRTKLGDADRYLEDIEEKIKPIEESTLSMKSLAEATVKLATSIFPIDAATVYFMDSRSQALYPFGVRKQDVAQIKKLSRIDMNHPLFKEMTNSTNILVKDELDQNATQGIILETMNTLQFEVIAPLVVSERLSGFIGLGPKNSGAPYHHRDKIALKKIAERIQTTCAYASAAEKYTVVMDDWAHSLNQVTKPIELCASQIEMFHDMWPWEKLQENLRTIKYRVSQLQKVHQYIANSATLSHLVVTGKYVMELVDVVSVIKKHLQIFQIEATNKKIKLESDIQNEPCSLLLNPIGLERLLDDLFTNAARHCVHEDGSGLIQVFAKAVGNDFELRVRDNGDGISPENLERIWEPGWQQKDMNTGVAGLGLAIARQIAEAHKGKIWAESPGKGMGSEFILKIPIVSERRGYQNA